MEEELLIEKWLTAYKKWGEIVDVFMNPTKKDFREIGNKSRFIADAKNKRVYVWGVMGDMHGDAWVKIKKELNDSRNLYKNNNGELITGVWEGTYANFRAMSHLGQYMRNEIKEQDWTFLYKYYKCEDDLMVYLK